MAQIYLARQSGLGSFERHVVLKTILRERAGDRRFVTMFLDEAKLAATLNHQNVAQVFEVDQADGAYFMAMEYVHGENTRAILETTIRRGWTIPLELAVTIVSGAAAGLHHAHERRGKNGAPLNIVHRDVSPANIMVGYDGSVKVLDFGIAKAEERATVTVGGTIKGKYGYMSPEQCKGKQIDRRSDIFALGIVLYELTTLRRAFKGVDDFETMKRIVGGELVLPSQLVHGFSRELEAIILTAMANDPAARFQTAQELTEALDAFMVRSTLTGSNTAMSRFMAQLFGSRKEPWIEGAAAGGERGGDNTVVTPREATGDDEDDDNKETLVSSNRQDDQRALEQLSAPARPSQPRPAAATPAAAIPVPVATAEPSGRVAREPSGRVASDRPSVRRIQDRPSLPFGAVDPPEPAAPPVVASHGSADHLAITAVGPVPSASAPTPTGAHPSVPPTVGNRTGHYVVPPTTAGATGAHAHVPGLASGPLSAPELPSPAGHAGWDPAPSAAPAPAVMAVPPAGAASPGAVVPRIRSSARWVILATVVVLVIAAIAVMMLDA